MDMWYFARICALAQSWREFAKCRFAHFPSFFSVHVDTYVGSTYFPQHLLLRLGQSLAVGNPCFNLFNMPIVLEHLLAIVDILFPPKIFAYRQP